jgi:FkbM family methyltransferase
MLSYAQHSEDVFLHRCFGQLERGFYIDLGAVHPVRGNASYHFYLRGWTGINVEPVPHRHSELKRARPRDINLHAAIGRRDGSTVVNLPSPTAEADGRAARRPQRAGFGCSQRPAADALQVGVLSLATLCELHAHSPIDFLKIHAAGPVADTIAGADWARWRPAVVLVETTVPGASASDTPFSDWAEWEPMLLSAGYRLAYFDGVNRFYVAAERDDLAAHFRTPINPFDGAVGLHSFGHVIEDSRHPDHAWVRVFLDRVLGAAAIESDAHILGVMTWDLSPGELEAPVTAAALRLAWQRVLARSPAEADIWRWTGRPDLTLERLYRELIASEEFRHRRSRVSVAGVRGTGWVRAAGP